MDENIEDSNLYRDAVRESEAGGVRPGFLDNSKSSRGGSGSGLYKSARRSSAKEALGLAEKNVTSGESGIGKVAKAVGGNKVGAVSKFAGGLFSGKGKGAAGKGSKKKIAKFSAIGFIGAGVSILGIGAAILGTPMLMISTIDYNLQDSLGFSETIATLEKQAEHTTVAMLKKGEVPDGYAKDLLASGINVGQLTADGDFVNTNVYIADLDSDEVASVGEYKLQPSANGELAVMYDGNIIIADDFVAAVESNPKMYAAYSDAVDISARFYYSDDVNKVYDELGISRGNFNNWAPTGDAVEDQKQFNDTLADMLESDSDLKVGGYAGENANNETTTIKTGDNASEKIEVLASSIKDGNTETSTAKAAQLLNAAISSNEPYKAAKAFIAVEEPIQRARIGDNGPVNEMMNTLSTETEFTYTDVNTGKEVTKKKSILTTVNFSAAVSKGGYSKNEANNFSRDRVLIATNTADGSNIKDTAVSTENSVKSNTILGMSGGVVADNDKLQVASDSLAIAATDDSSTLFTSEVGGNRIVEGGSFISNTINARTLGAMPSDATTIAKYHHEVEEILARKAEAERATKSPFDISSPYTFMGRLAHSIVGAYVGNLAGHGDGAVVGSVASTMVGLTNDSIGGLIGDVVADGSDDKNFTTISGDCYTVNTANGVEGDLYCNSHNTISTKYMDYDEDDWKAELSGDLDGSGKIIVKEGGLSDFVMYGMDREATVGVKSVDVCESYRKVHGNVFTQIIDAYGKIYGLYQACSSEELNIAGVDVVQGVPEDISSGAKYTLSASNINEADVEKYSGYVLYDTVKSLLSESKSAVSEFRDGYYALYPKDNSETGVIARRSGMSKAEAQIALDYAEGLTVIANYNPAGKYVFGQAFEMPKKDMLVEHSDTVQVSLYCIWCGKTEYADVRNKNFAA